MESSKANLFFKISTGTRKNFFEICVLFNTRPQKRSPSLGQTFATFHISGAHSGAYEHQPFGA